MTECIAFITDLERPCVTTVGDTCHHAYVIEHRHKSQEYAPTPRGLIKEAQIPESIRPNKARTEVKKAFPVCVVGVGASESTVQHKQNKIVFRILYDFCIYIESYPF